MVRGALWFSAGSAVTLITYMAAARSPIGGYYIIAWGSIVFGAVQFFQGLAAINAPSGQSNPSAGPGFRCDRSLGAKDLLDRAALFESVDRRTAIALYAEIIRRFPGTRSSDEAQRNIQTLQAPPIVPSE
jgi:hypothetical protein